MRISHHTHPSVLQQPPLNTINFKHHPSNTTPLTPPTPYTTNPNTKQVINYDDPAQFAAERDYIREVFAPLVEKCKSLNRAMRIGTNHGSLSARILSYYGDTPRGMVESAFEFADICREMDYHNFVFSMKASNPLVMVQAYRLLSEEMYARGWDYPLHLGVTEV